MLREMDMPLDAFTREALRRTVHKKQKETEMDVEIGKLLSNHPPHTLVTRAAFFKRLHEKQIDREIEELSKELGVWGIK